MDLVRLIGGVVDLKPAGTGEFRITFGIDYLYDGLPLVVVGVGLFAFPEIIDLLRRDRAIASGGKLTGRWSDGLRDLFITDNTQIGGNIKPPVIITKFKPRYTEEARKARIEGIVLLQTVVDTRGNVTRVQVVKGLTMGLTESAIETVQQWKYKPATLDGKPVEVFMLMQVRFSLQ